jgi:glutamyl-tRNA synthetase
MTRAELIERFSLDRVQSSPARFDYQKLDWMNGEHLRRLPPDEYAHRLIVYLGERGYDWDADLVRRAAPLVQAKLEKLGDFPDYARFLFEPVEPDPAELDGGEEVLAAAEEALAELDSFTTPRIEAALRGVVERLGLKPRQGFQTIRIAVTGSRVSPGLFESLELLGRDESLARIRAATGGAASAG